MRIGLVLLPLLFAAIPASADGLVTTTQVVNGQIAGDVPSSGGNISVITQDGTGNSAETDQIGTSGQATIGQTGNNNYSLIQQSGVGDSATNTQIGNSLSMTIRQTGPAQSVVVTQH